LPLKTALGLPWSLCILQNILNIKVDDLDKYVYRIISIDRLVELFSTHKNVLVAPSLWDDPYENFILKSKIRKSSGKVVDYKFHNNFYGQCWSFHKASDAMWRIYSPDSKGVRIRTTIRKLITSLYKETTCSNYFTSYIGKVEYLKESELKEFSNSLFYDDRIENENLFRSLLVKRKAFKHEGEIRLLYFDLIDEIEGRTNSSDKTGLFSYTVDPHILIDQFMLDPRLDAFETAHLKGKLKELTGFEGAIKRSLLYSAPEEVILNVNKA
jgi:hypothetical protein